MRTVSWIYTLFVVLGLGFFAGVWVERDLLDRRAVNDYPSWQQSRAKCPHCGDVLSVEIKAVEQKYDDSRVAVRTYDVTVQ